MMPAMPAPMMATVVVVGDRHRARQYRLRELKPALLEQQRDELVVDV